MSTPTRAEAHVDGQEALTALIPALLREAWPLLDVHNLRGTLPDFIAAVRSIVERFGQASAVAALDYYRAERAAAGVPGSVSATLAPSPADSVIEEAVRGATADLYGTVTPESEQAALDRLNGEVQKLVADQARATVTETVNADRRARGWARVPNADACAFCLMLATRDVFYKSAESAGRRDATTKWADAKGYINSFHPNCRCQVEPVFGVYEPTARTRDAQALWKESTKGLYGKDAMKAFRRAVEDRASGPTRKQKPRSK